MGYGRIKAPWKRYLVAVVCTGAAVLVRWSLPSVLAGTPYLAFYPAVVFAAAFGGMGAGVAATVACVLCVDLLFDSTPGWLALSDPVAVARLAIFLSGGIGTSVIAGMQQAARERERRQAEVLRGSEERLRGIFDNAGVGILEVDAAERFIAANDRVMEILRYPRAKLLGMSVPDLTHPDDHGQSDQHYAQLHDGRLARFDQEKRYVRPDGSEVWVHLTVSAVRDAAGRYVGAIATVQDINERKAAESALAAAKLSAERAKAAAEQANQAKDHFLAVLSHELRTPLTPALAAVSMLQTDSRLPADVLEDLEVIRRNVEMEGLLIDDLLDVTRIARGKIVLNKCRVELREVVERAVEVCKPEAEAKRLNIELDAGPGESYTVEADAARLQQVFWNVIKNSVKFTPQGGRVRACCRPDGDGVVVEVSDDGPGIEAEALPRIFNAFEQGEQSTTRRFGGLGLGLAISKALVEMHGGTIEAHSEGRGRGATFRVRLPLISPELKVLSAESEGGRVPMARQSEQDLRGTAPARALRVLLVEDHADTAKVVSRLLARRGYEVQTAGDAAGALELAAGNGFDLVISDLGLPDGSGLELMRDLRARGHKQPAIALSGYGTDEDVKRSREAGFAAHLTKPMAFEQLYETIAGVVR